MGDTSDYVPIPKSGGPVQTDDWRAFNVPPNDVYSGTMRVVGGAGATAMASIVIGRTDHVTLKVRLRHEK